MLVIESFEATQTKRGDMILTFDSDSLRPTGDLISADVERGALFLEWADETRAMLPDVRDRLAECVAAAPVLSVRWTADGLLRSADFARS